MIKGIEILHDRSDAVDVITLDETARHRRRIRLVSDGGIEFVLDLPETVLLHDGDCIRLEDGRLIQVRAAPEPLYEVRADEPTRLMALIWHIGNRHLPAQIFDDRVLIRRDHVIKAMLEGLGGRVDLIEAPFSPERGAYDHTHHAAHG